LKRPTTIVLLFILLGSLLSACGGGTDLRYSVTGTAQEVSIRYMDGEGVLSPETKVQLPYELEYNVGSAFAFRIDVSNISGAGEVQCEVFADGQSLGKADGNTFAGCEGTFETSGGKTQIHFTSTNDDQTLFTNDAATPTQAATQAPAKEIDLGGAFISAIGNSENGAAIYLFDTSTTQIVQWTEPLLFIGSMDWFPTSSKIILNTGSTGNVNSYVTELDGFSPTQTTKITSESDAYPDWSPNGEQIAVDAAASEGHHIFVMNANGTARTQITSGEKVINSKADWSPDGTKIVFSSLVDYTKSTLIVVNIDGTESIALLEAKDGEAYLNPVWSPNGEQIAFILDIKGPEASVYVMEADGTNVRAVTQTPAYSINSIAWAPDGTRLIFNATKETTGFRGIYMINLDGSDLTYLTGVPEVNLEGLHFVPQGYITALPTQPVQLLP